MTHEVIAFSGDGRTASVLATAGQGPGELQRVLSVVVPAGDSVWVEDDGNGKIMLLVGGEVARTVSTQGDFMLTQGLRILGQDPSGRFLMTTSAFSPRFEEPWLDGSMVLFDPETLAADTVGAYPMVQRAAASGINPFRSHGAITAAGGAFVHARSDQAEVIWRAADGRIRQVVRWAPAPSHPTDEHWARFEEAMRAALARVNPQLAGGDLERMIDERIARYALHPEAPLPLFGALHGDDAGGVWLAGFSPGYGDLPDRYQVISPDGEWLGTVAFPTPLRILDIRGGLVLGTVEDEMDVQGIAAYRVRWAGGGS